MAKNIKIKLSEPTLRRLRELAKKEHRTTHNQLIYILESAADEVETPRQPPGFHR